MTPDLERNTLPVAAPPRVAELLRHSPDGPVHVLHLCAEIVHLDIDGRAIAITAAGAPGLPHALRTNLRSVSSAGSSGAVPTAYREEGVLHWGRRALVTRRYVDVRAPRIAADRIPQTSPVSALGTPRPRGAGLVAVPPRIDADTASDLVGRGEGLTPFGDDVLCGWLAAHRAAGVPTPEVDEAVRRSLPATTTVSATLLECALAGEAADLVVDYLRALGTPYAGAARTARTALLGLGHSSGSGLALGVDLALAGLAQVAA